jgi:hypothetical protein
MRWLPDTSQGRMVADYFSTSFGSDGLAHPAFAVAGALGGANDCANAPPDCDRALYSPTSGLAVSGGSRVANDPVPFTGKVSHAASAFKRR